MALWACLKMAIIQNRNLANNEELQSGENENLNSVPKTEGLDGDKKLN